jgi:lipid II:glycine glycyltransferase (peptidoglycan interpeptide bridge formation enzyme)
MANVVQILEKLHDEAVWDRLVAATPGGHVLQSWAWGELKARFGWYAQRVALGSACAQVLYRSLPGRLGSIAYIPKGPLGTWGDDGTLAALLEAIGPLARRRRAICLKIEPNLGEDPALTERLQTLGFRRSPQTIQPRRTIIVNLDTDRDVLLQRMKQKTRYNIRLAGRRGVTVRPGDESDLPAFYHLMQITGERDEFGIHSQAYYAAIYRLFVLRGHGQLLLAEYEGQLLAGLIVLASGNTAIYMTGASSSEERQRMPTYLLQWEAMCWAAEKGCRQYDLWGVPDEEEETLEAEFSQRSDGLWGVYRFKRGFGGRLVQTTGAWDLVYAPLHYRLYTAAVGWLNRRQDY